MKKYTVIIQNSARKALKNLDIQVRNRIVEWIEKNLKDCTNPRFQGKTLKGKLAGKWRYRVGDYRIIADIQDDKVVIFVIDVDKRNDIYRKFAAKAPSFNYGDETAPKIYWNRK